MEKVGTRISTMSKPVVDNIKGALDLKKKPNDKRCDFTIKVGENSIRVHRSKLRKATDYFDKKHPMSFDASGKVCHEDAASFAAVKTCVDFFYKIPVVLNMDNLGELLKLSKKWRVRGLLAMCEKYTIQQINPTSCVRMKRLAQEIEESEIVKTVDNYILVHLDKVVGGDAFADLTEDELTTILNDYVGPIDEFGIPDLKHRDAILWNLLTSWVKFYQEDRKHLFCRYFRDAPFSFFDAVMIDKVILQEPLVKDCQECFKHVCDTLLEVLEHRIEFTKSAGDFGLGGEFCSPQESFFLKAFAEKFGRKEIADKVTESMKSSFDEVIIHSKFGNLSKDELVQYIRGLHQGPRSDIQVWNAITTWVKCEPEREEDFAELFRMVNLENLPLNFLQSIVIPENLTHVSPECTEAVMKALVEYAQKENRENRTDISNER